jgi:phosphate starvation-inducible PhoH-like protein
MFMTRIGFDSKAAINGDVGQTDLRGDMYGGLDACMARLEDVDGVSVCELDTTDIIRHKVIGRILARL